MLDRFKKKWNINSNFQLIMILIVFSVAGSSTLYVRKFVFNWLGVTADTSLWIKVPLYVIIIFPAYQVLLLLFGTLLGQFKFAWEFEKKVFSRFKFRKK